MKEEEERDLQNRMEDRMLLTMVLLGHLGGTSNQEWPEKGKVYQELQRLLIVTFFKRNLNLLVVLLITVCTRLYNHLDLPRSK